MARMTSLSLLCCWEESSTSLFSCNNTQLHQTQQDTLDDQWNAASMCSVCLKVDFLPESGSSLSPPKPPGRWQQPGAAWWDNPEAKIQCSLHTLLSVNTSSCTKMHPDSTAITTSLPGSGSGWGVRGSLSKTGHICCTSASKILIQAASRRGWMSSALPWPDRDRPWMARPRASEKPGVWRRWTDVSRPQNYIQWRT